MNKPILLRQLTVLATCVVLWPHAAAVSQERARPCRMVDDRLSRTTFECAIHPDLPLYVFDLIWSPDPDFRVVERVAVSRQDKPSIIQTLDAGMGEPPYSKEDGFQAEDINFDGYRDIRVLTWWGVTGNEGHRYWLFDKASGLFRLNQELSGLCNPTPHPDTRELTTFSTGGMAGGGGFIPYRRIALTTESSS